MHAKIKGMNCLKRSTRNSYHDCSWLLLLLQILAFHLLLLNADFLIC